MYLTDYTKIKDKYCISYFGNNHDYVVQLKLLRPSIEKQLHGIQVILACSKAHEYLLKGEKNVLFEEPKDVYTRKLTSSNHPVYELFKESDLEIKPICSSVRADLGICLICPEGITPTKSVVNPDGLARKAKKEGYEPVILGSDIHYSCDIKLRPSGEEKLKYIDNAVKVIGVENEYLFLAAAQGKQTELITTGFGAELYLKMFPCGKVIKN